MHDSVELIIVLLILSVVMVSSFVIVLVFQYAKLWPVIKGKVVRKSVSPVALRNKHYYKNSIEYSYHCDGVEYHSKRISLFGNRLYDSENQAAEVVKVINNEVDVYVFPHRPSVSYLHQDSRVFYGAIAAFFLSVVLLGLCIKLFNLGFLF